MRAPTLRITFRRCLLTLLACGAVVTACTQGELSTGADVPAQLLLSPVFQVVPDPAAGPIDRIRMTAYDVATDEVVGSFDDTVDPTANEWAIELGIDLDGEPSLEVIVDVELLSGGVVEWSGRVGPLVVTTSGVPGSQQVEVARGPLDNLDVTAVTIGQAPSQIDVAERAQLTAAATLTSGSNATPEIFWVSLDESVATVDGLDGNATVIGVAPGTVTIVAVAGLQADSVTIEVVDVATGLKSWVGGDTDNPTDWFTNENWSPIGVPTVNDDVFIADAAAGDPVLAASFQVGSLRVDAEASVDLGGMGHDVRGGDLIADGPLLNGGVTVVDPGDFRLEGTVDELRTLDDRTLSGTLNADIVRVAEERLTIGPNLLNVSDMLRLLSFPGSATMAMNDVNGIVRVGGVMSVQGGDLEGLLTAGQLFIGGNLEAGGTRFAATQDHLTNFNGLAPQTISLGTAGPTGARFHDLTISGADVDIDTDVYASGDLVVTGAFTVPAGRTVDIAGSITLQAGATFTVDGTVTAVGGCTVNGATVSGSGTSPCAQQLTTVTWVGGVGVDPVDAEDPLNWSPQQVPDAFSNVVIPVTANDPIVQSGGTYSLASLTIADGASLDLGGGDLNVLGNIDTGDTGVIAGVVIVTGPSAVLQGTFESLEIGFARVMSGPVSVTSDLRLEADLDVGGNTLTALDLFVQDVGASLGMTDPADVVNISGGATFAGGSHTNRLTAGQLNIEGDFTASGLSAAFVAFGDHVTSFVGSSVQTVSFTNPGIVGHRFNDVLFDNTAGVNFLSDVYAEGTVSISEFTPVNGLGFTLGVAEALDDFYGGLNVGTVEVLGDLIDFPGLLNADLVVQAAWTLTGSIDVFGNVLLNNNDLSIGGNTLTVDQNFEILGSGAQLTMDDPNGLLDIDGNAIFGGSGQQLQLSTGEIQLAGDFTSSGSSTSMGATGNHVVTLDGTSNQTITMSQAGLFDQHFFDLTVTNTTGGIIFASDVAVEGTLTIPAGAGVDGTGFGLIVGGGLDDGSDGIIIDQLFIEGNLAVFPGFIDADVYVGADFDAIGGFFAGQSLFLDADFVVGADASGVGGDLFVQSTGRLVMSDALGSMNVQGNATFNGASHVGALTAGALLLEGNLSVLGAATSFTATNNHLTRFTGGAAQTVSFETPGRTAQRFNDVSVENSFGVELLTDVALVGGLTVTPNSLLNGADDVLSVEDFFDNQGNTLLSELEITGDLTIFPATIAYDTRVTGAFDPGSLLTIDGNLAIDGGLFTVGAQTITVNQDFSVVNNGALLMQNAAGSLNVFGSVAFVGGSTVAALTAGQIQLLGDFSASGSSTAFVSSGTHVVRFVGSGAQEITFDNPGPTTQRFQNMDIRNFSGSVDFGSTVVVMGTFDQSDGDLNRTGPVGSILDVRGTLLLDEANISGLPISLNSAVAPQTHTMNLVTFAGMDPTETQLTLSLPGTGQVPGLTANDVTFSTAPTTGFYVNVSSNNGQPWALQMGGTPFPGSQPARVVISAPATIIWPWP